MVLCSALGIHVRQRLIHRLRLHHHAGAAAVGIVVHHAMLIVGVVTDVVEVDLGATHPLWREQRCSYRMGPGTSPETG